MQAKPLSAGDTNDQRRRAGYGVEYTQIFCVGDLVIEFYELEKYLIFHLDWDQVFPGVAPNSCTL